jgi:Zn-dependent oligopeptidase
MKQAYLSAFDVENHLTNKFWLDNVQELWPRYMPFELTKLDYHPCQFSYAFAENYGATYYSHLWSDVCDILSKSAILKNLIKFLYLNFRSFLLIFTELSKKWVLKMTITNA